MKEPHIAVYGNTVIFQQEKGRGPLHCVHVGDVVSIPFWITDDIGENIEIEMLVEVAAICTGEDAGSYGDIGFYYRDQDGAPGQDFTSPTTIINIYRKERCSPGASPAGPGLSGNAPGANDRSAT